MPILFDGCVRDRLFSGVLAQFGFDPVGFRSDPGEQVHGGCFKAISGAAAGNPTIFSKIARILPGCSM
jgi:hypothetical protein